MQIGEEYDFELVPDEPKDIVWLYSDEGKKWAMDQQPNKRTTRPTKAERDAIVKHLARYMEGVPEQRLRAMTEGKYNKRLWIEIPFYHTTYVSDVNRYWHWYQNIRPGHDSWVLSDYLEAQEMYPIFLAIARERQNIRRAR